MTKKNDKRHIFMSFAGEDEEIAQLISQVFELEDYNYWNYTIDPVYIGQQLSEELQTRLDNSIVMVILLSSVSVAKEWVKNEIARAKNTHKPILPIILEGGSEIIPIILGYPVYVDISDIEQQRKDGQSHEYLKGQLQERFKNKYMFESIDRLIDLPLEDIDKPTTEPERPKSGITHQQNIEDRLEVTETHNVHDDEQIIFLDDLATRGLINATETASSFVDIEYALVESNQEGKKEYGKIAARAAIFAVDIFSFEELYIVAATTAAQNDFDDTELLNRFKRNEGMVGKTWADEEKYLMFNPSVRPDGDKIIPNARVHDMKFWLGVPIIHPKQNFILGMLIVEHPEELLRILPRHKIIEMIEYIIELADFAAELFIMNNRKDDRKFHAKNPLIYPLSFYTFMSLRHILRVSRRLPMFLNKNGEVSIKRDLRIRSAIRYRYIDDQGRDGVYSIASSQGFYEAELTRIFYKGQLLVGRVLSEGTVLFDDRPASVEEREEYLRKRMSKPLEGQYNEDGSFNVTDDEIREQLKGLTEIISVIGIPIFGNRNSGRENIIGVFTIASYKSMEKTQLNHPSLIADALRLANLASKLIMSELYNANRNKST